MSFWNLNKAWKHNSFRNLGKYRRKIFDYRYSGSCNTTFLATFHGSPGTAARPIRCNFRCFHYHFRYIHNEFRFEIHFRGFIIGVILRLTAWRQDAVGKYRLVIRDPRTSSIHVWRDAARFRLRLNLPSHLPLFDIGPGTSPLNK